MTDLAGKLTPELSQALESIGHLFARNGKPVGNDTSASSTHPGDQARGLIDTLSTWLLDDEQKQAIAANPWQAFLLQAGAILGDFPLTHHTPSQKGQPAEEPTTEGNLSALLALGMPDADPTRLLAHLVTRMSIMRRPDALSARPGKASADGMTVDIDMPAACLVLAKALDLKAEATLKDIAAHLPHEAAGLARRLEETFEVHHAGPHPYFPATIQVKITCRHSETHRALKHYERRVQELLHSINQCIRPRFLFSDLIFEIEPVSYQPVDLKFTVDSSAALQLFMGQRLYADKRVFLRELIQNALDACSLRQLDDATYKPSIAIAFNDDISVITVEDNGIGMDRQWVEKYFLSIGISFYKSSAIQDINRNAHIDIGFISQFGIGFLSAFLVAEKIVIKTRKAGHQGLKITITGLKDYFDVRPLEDEQPVGTHVALYLKKSKINFCRSLEYAGYLKTNIRFLQAPVRFTDERGKTVTIGQAPLSYAAVKTAATDFTAALAFESSEGYLYLGTKMHTEHIFALETAKGGVSLFQDGIFITHEETLLPEGARQHVVGRINLKGADKCELSMDRNRIFWTQEQKNDVRRSIRHGLVDLANQVMAAMDDQDVTGNTYNSVVNHLAVFFSFSDVDDAMHQALAEPIRRIVEKRFRDFIRVHFAHTLRAEGIPEADGYNEQWQQGILSSFVHKN